VRGSGGARLATLQGRGGRESSSPARARVWPGRPRVVDPRHLQRSGSRNSLRPLGRSEILAMPNAHGKLVFSSSSTCLLAAKQPAFIRFHIPGPDHSYQTSRQSPEHDESEAAVQCLAQGDGSLPACSPDLMIADEDFLHFLQSKLVPLDMEDVVIIPLKAGNDQAARSTFQSTP